jgi:hypothetical protein
MDIHSLFTLRKFSQHLQQFPAQSPQKIPNRYGSPTVEVFAKKRNRLEAFRISLFGRTWYIYLKFISCPALGEPLPFIVHRAGLFWAASHLSATVRFFYFRLRRID